MVVHPFHQSANRPMPAGPFMAPGGFAMMEMMTRQQQMQQAAQTAHGQQSLGQFGALFGKILMGADGIWGRRLKRFEESRLSVHLFLSSGRSFAIHAATFGAANATASPGHAIPSRLVPVAGLRSSPATGTSPTSLCQWRQPIAWPCRTRDGQGDGTATAEPFVAGGTCPGATAATGTATADGHDEGGH